MVTSVPPEAGCEAL